MMLTERKRKKEHSAHNYKKVDRSTDGIDYHYYQCSICNQVTYPPTELQKLWELSECGKFMFVQDWILALMIAQPMPVVGITSFTKQLFLVIYEFAPEHNIPTENPGFRAYKFGPYAERIEDVIIGLEDAGLIRTEGRKGAAGEYFLLTDKGKEVAERALAKLTKKQQEAFREARMDWHQLGSEGLMTYIYKKYPRMAEESLILERVLKRRRLGKLTSRDLE